MCGLPTTGKGTPSRKARVPRLSGAPALPGPPLPLTPRPAPGTRGLLCNPVLPAPSPQPSAPRNQTCGAAVRPPSASPAPCARLRAGAFFTAPTLLVPSSLLTPGHRHPRGRAAQPTARRWRCCLGGADGGDSGFYGTASGLSGQVLPDGDVSPADRATGMGGGLELLRSPRRRLGARASPHPLHPTPLRCCSYSWGSPPSSSLTDLVRSPPLLPLHPTPVSWDPLEELGELCAPSPLTPRYVRARLLSSNSTAVVETPLNSVSGKERFGPYLLFAESL